MINTKKEFIEIINDVLNLTPNSYSPVRDSLIEKLMNSEAVKSLEKIKKHCDNEDGDSVESPRGNEYYESGMGSGRLQFAQEILNYINE